MLSNSDTQSNKKGSPSGPTAPGNGTNGAESFHVHELLPALQAMRVGDFTVRISRGRTGTEGKIADILNEIAATNERMAQQLERVGQRVGKEGKTKQRVRFGLSSGAWGEMESSVNT